MPPPPSGSGNFNSPANLAHVAQLARRFLYDKFHWTPPPALQFDALVRDVMKSFANVAAQDPPPPVAELNKMVISRVRSMVIPVAVAVEEPGLPYIDRGSSERNAEAGAGAEAEVGAAPVAEADNDPGTSMDDEDSFMTRLQELEAQRKSIQIQPLKPPTSTEAAPTPAPAAPAPPATAPPPQRIYMTAPPPKPGIPIIIHGWHRNVRDFPDRAAFAWNGPIPPAVDKTSLKVALVILPKSVSSTDPTPYVRMRIEGAGKQAAECILVPKEGTGTCLHYQPAAPSFAQIVALGLPWNIRLFNAEGHTLNIGHDSTRIHSVRELNNQVIIEFTEEPKRHSAAAVGDILHIHKANGDISRTSVVAKTPNGLLIASDGGHAGDTPLTDGLVVNVSQQVVVILEGFT